MSFRLPDLILESIIREGFTAVRRDPTIIDDLFGDMDLDYTRKKYGQKELNRIKEFVTEKEVSVVQAFSQVPANLPCISIQLISSTEAKNYTVLDDFSNDESQPLSIKEEADREILDEVMVTSYDPLTGIVKVANATDLDAIVGGNIFVDASGNEFKIIGGIDTRTNKKKFTLEKGLNPDMTDPGRILSSIDWKQFEQRVNTDSERLLLGIHTEERLLTIYVYLMVKYFILSRKKYLIERGFQIASYDASDFTRNLDYKEPVFSRFLTVSGITTNEWLSDKVQPIENIDTIVTVERDVADTEEVNRTDMTVQVSEDDYQEGSDE